MKMGRANPVIPTQDMSKSLPEIAERWLEGYVEAILDLELAYPYRIRYKVKDAEYKGVGTDNWDEIELKEAEFRFLPTKPFDKNDWL